MLSSTYLDFDLHILEKLVDLSEHQLARCYHGKSAWYKLKHFRITMQTKKTGMLRLLSL